jgi:hypothetical protein
MTMSDLVAFLHARLDEDERYLNSNRHHLWTQRPLREIEVKRAIVAEHGPDCTGFFGETVPAMCQRCITDREGYEEQWQGDPYPCLTLRLLAAVYSDHPDYQQAWVPASA